MRPDARPDLTETSPALSGRRIETEPDRMARTRNRGNRLKTQL
jgi:hypothetical protein